MSKAMKLSGAETLSASANIFVGQTEAPLLIKPYLGRMTKSEMLAIMIGGMANTAGGVMAVYVTLLGGNLISAAGAHGIAVASRSTFNVQGAGNQVVGNATNGLMLSDKGTTGRISVSMTFSTTSDSGMPCTRA